MAILAYIVNKLRPTITTYGEYLNNGSLSSSTNMINSPTRKATSPKLKKTVLILMISHGSMIKFI
jgi:hypothetical protein